MQMLLETMRYPFIAVIGAVLISACSFQPTPLTEQEQVEKLGQFIAAGGYSPAHAYQIESFSDNWLHDGQTLQVSLTAPTEPSIYPVIFYLPGLGESANAGRLWRENWAKAGYLVLAVQETTIAQALAELKPAFPDKLPEDKVERRRLQSLRNSELRYIGHEFFSSKSLAKRVEQVLWAHAQLLQRTKAGQRLFAKADLSHIILVGYDIGAQTAAALIGEDSGIPSPQNAAFKPQAAILISPSVDPAMGNVDKRFRDIQMPFLVITSDADDDPYAISSPQVRTAIWEYAPDGQHYLLLLKNAPHYLLSGSGWPGQERFEEQADSEEWRSGTGKHTQRGSRSHRGSGGAGRAMPFQARGKEKVEANQSVAAVFSVSSAFLDSIVKTDNFAALWLNEQAKNWLDKVATLKSK